MAASTDAYTIRTFNRYWPARLRHRDTAVVAVDDASYSGLCSLILNALDGPGVQAILVRDQHGFSRWSRGGGGYLTRSRRPKLPAAVEA